MKRDTLIKTHVVKQLSQLMGTEIMQRFTLVRMSKFCGIKLKKENCLIHCSE